MYTDWHEQLLGKCKRSPSGGYQKVKFLTKLNKIGTI